MSDSKPVIDKMLVCVGSGQSSMDVIRQAAETAKGSGARLFAVYVETPRSLLLTEKERDRAVDNLRAAEQMGAETATLSGRNIADEIIKFATGRGIRKIIAGKPRRSTVRNILHAGPVDRLVRNGAGLDVEIVSGVAGEAVPVPYKMRTSEFPWSDYGTGFLLLVLATVLCYLMYPRFALSNLIMVYLVAVMLTAIESGRGPAIVVSALSVLTFDFCFVPPRYSFTVDDAQYIVTFIVMFVVAVAISHLAGLMRKQTMAARLQERQATSMHGLSRQLASSRSVDNTLRIGGEYISEIFDSGVLVLLPDESGRLKTAWGDSDSVFVKDVSLQLDIARKAFESGRSAGLGTESDGQNEVLYVPISAADLAFGVLALRPGDPGRLLLPDQRHLLESLVKQVALSLEVEYMAEIGVPLRQRYASFKPADTTESAPEKLKGEAGV